MIPKHDEIRVPALSLLAKHGQLKLSEFEAPLAKHFGLSADEIQEEYESGNGKIFYDRISWALSYMNMAGLVSKPKRGVYEISELGKAQLKNPNSINQFIAEEFAKKHQNQSHKSNKIALDETNLTPQEELYESAKKIREARETLINPHPSNQRWRSRSKGDETDQLLRRRVQQQGTRHAARAFS